MINKHIWKKGIYLGLIVTFMWGFILFPVGTINVYGQETEDVSEKEEPENLNDQQSEGSKEENEEPDETETGNSGGFTIHSDKVEGDMDMNAALKGDIHIKEGTIEGLTITKVLDTEDERGSLMVQVTSPGPVDIKELKTKTQEGPPKFGGVCGLDPICLEDVTMTVDHQEVEDINLPDAQITTCFASECEDMPDSNSDDDTETKDVMQTMQAQQLTLEEIMDGLADDKKKLEDIQNLLERAVDRYDTIQEKGQVKELSQVIKKLNQTLPDVNSKNTKDADANTTEEENNDNSSTEEQDKGESDTVDEITVSEDHDGQDREQSEEEESAGSQRKEVQSETDTAENQLHDLIEQAADQYENFDNISEAFSSTLDKALTKISNLKESIKVKENALESIENEQADMQGSEAKERADDLNRLQKAAEEEQNASEADKDSADDNQEGGKQVSKTDQSVEYQLAEVKDALETFKGDFETLQQHAGELKEVEDVLREKKATITNALAELKTLLIDDLDDLDIDEHILKKLPGPSIMKEDNNLDEKDEAANGSEDTQSEKSRDVEDESDKETNHDDQKADSPGNEAAESENKSTSEDQNPNGEKESLIKDLLESIEGVSP